MIPEGHTIEDIKTRERIIRDFYREWKEKNPSQRKFNLSLKEYINIRMVSIVETSEHAAKSYLSTLAPYYNWIRAYYDYVLYYHNLKRIERKKHLM